MTAPAAKTDLVYRNGEAQALITAGSSTTGTIQYKLNNGEYSTALPEATNAGTYTVSYKVVGDENHEDVDEASFSVTIGRQPSPSPRATRPPMSAARLPT
ncbi:MAG: copper resistance protein CopC [Oscillospiraceae bacterium]